MSIRAILLVLALTLAGCGGRLGPGSEPLEPLSLSYPYPVEKGLPFPDFRVVAERNAGIYVRVVIESQDDGPSAGHERSAGGVINAASGIIVHSDGLVVTAAHIALSTALRGEIITADGRSHPARVLSVDPDRELAVLKMAPFPGMQMARFADSSRVEPGEPALAIGTPGNRRAVVTVGKVAAPRLRKRISYPPYGFDNALELAMEVEPGHSGGPILNRRGELIGMVASFVLGDVSKRQYVSPRITHGVPSNDIAAYLLAKSGT